MDIDYLFYYAILNSINLGEKMKKLILGIALGLSSMVAFAQQAPMPMQQNPGGYQMNQPNPAQRQERFEQRKSMILQHMQQRQEKLNQAINCVQAAQSFDALRDCRPHRS
jgi:TolA-binding protein